MLVLARKFGEKLLIGDDIEVQVVDIRGDTVRLGITAPQQVPIKRPEAGQKRRPPLAPWFDQAAPVGGFELQPGRRRPMRVIMQETRAMEIPLERLKFDPDPLSINAPIECDCPTCQIKRQLAAMHGVPVSAVQIHAMTPIVSPAVSTESTVSATPWPPTVADLAEEFDLPPCMVWTAKVFAYAFAYAYVAVTAFHAFVMGRPRLRVVREGD